MFAAGVGERLRPHTDHLAKPAIPFLNVPMMGFPLFYLEQAGLKQLIINTHHLPNTIEASAQRMVSRKVKVNFSSEKELILGSGGGLAQAIANYGESEDLVIANADAVAIYHDVGIVKQMIEKQRSTQAIATLVVCPFPKAKESFGGVYVAADGRVRKFSKTALKDRDLTAYHFTGFMMVSAKVWQGLPAKPSNLLYDVLQPLMDSGHPVQSLIVSEVNWFETGNQKDYLNATSQCLDILSTPGAAQRSLIRIMDRYTPAWWKGWRTSAELKVLGSLPWPDRLRITDFAVFGPDAQFGVGAHLERSVVAGAAHLQDGQHCKDMLITG